MSDDTWTALPPTDKADVAHLLRLAAVSMRSNAAADRRRGFLPRADDADRLAAAHLALADHIYRSIGREPPAELPLVTWVDAPALRVETRGRMVWDSLHVVECRGASGTLPPEWDVRDETGCAYAMSCPTREDAERVAAMLRAVAARLKP